MNDRPDAVAASADTPCRAAFTPSVDPLAEHDPEGAVRAALIAPPDPHYAPEDVVLAWLLRLPDRIDPALAAAEILAARSGADSNPPLRRLLAEVAAWPRDRLRSLRRHRASGIFRS